MSRRTRKLSKQEFQAAFRLPFWVPTLYALAALALIPWISILTYALPAHHLVTHWGLAWGGFDFGLFASIAITAYLSFRRSGWVIFAAVATGTLLVVDAWFDIVTSHTGSELHHSIFEAFLAELPLAFLSFWLAAHTGRELLPRSKKG